MKEVIDTILKEFGFDPASTRCKAHGSGLINNTWVIERGPEAFILQKINNFVFPCPEDIAYNIRLMADYLKRNQPEYFFVEPLKNTSGADLVVAPEGYFRIFPYVANSHTIDIVREPDQAFEAARQFGRFSRMLDGLDVRKLRVTIPDFHNLGLRYAQFEKAVQEGNPERVKEAAPEVSSLAAGRSIVDQFEQIRANPRFAIRATHHDTKISNVLFDLNDKGICVIDLDTTMPGYFISDVGDMLRTYLSPVSEEEKDFSRIEVREEYFDAIASGYLKEMEEILSDDEKNAFVYSGKFMIYMQALRFLADYLNNDCYYGSAYEGHNLMRARNQIILLEKLMEKEKSLLAFMH